MTAGNPGEPESLTPLAALRVLDRFYDDNGPDERVASALTRLWNLALNGK